MSEHPLLLHHRMQGVPMDPSGNNFSSIMLKVRMSDLAAAATLRHFVLFIANNFWSADCLT